MTVSGVFGSLPRCPHGGGGDPRQVSDLTPGAARRERAAAPGPLAEPLPGGDLRLNSAQKVAPSLFSFLSGFKAASKFLRSQILPGTARKPGQQQVRAVSVPTTQPGLLLSCGWR